MIVALLLIALLQDGPVQTAPPTVEASTTPAVSEEQVAEAGQAAGGAEPSVREICDSPANRRVTESAFACAVRLERERRGPMRYGRLRPAAAREGDAGVPAWALTDPARWETSQCGAVGDDACRRQARNRLAMARAGLASDATAPTDAAAAPRPEQTCRMEMRPSPDGFGGSLTRVCGDLPAGSARNELFPPRPATAEPCDRPARLESQAAWIARCQALPDR
jgi:hypothetical protein